MKNFHIILVSVFSSLLGCSPEKSGSTMEHQAYEYVFNEVIQDASDEILLSSMYSVGIAKGKSAHDMRASYESLKNVPAHLLEEIIAGNGDLDWKPVVVSAKLIDLNGDEPNVAGEIWKSFREIYPNQGGYYSVSRVAIDYENRNAVFIFSYRCPALCGAHDTVVHLKKSGMKWSLLSATRLWVS